MTISAWIKSGRCIGVTHLRRGFKIPKWQFEPYVFPVIQALSEALGTTDGWQILSFLETPHEALDGLAPRIALEREALQILPARRTIGTQRINVKGTVPPGYAILIGAAPRVIGQFV